MSVSFLRLWTITAVFHILVLISHEFISVVDGNAILPFFVGPDDDNAAVVNTVLDSSGASVTCEFTYHTLNKKSSLKNKLQNSINPNQQTHHRSMLKDPSAILGKLSGVCTRKTMDYWKYELCFEAKVTQGHGRDSNNLGVYVRMDGNAQVYADGSPCEALQDRVGRTSRVEFVCDKNLRLLSVEEISTCNYRLIVSTPIVCGHPEFSQASEIITEDNKGVEAQSWFLELTEMDGHQVACTGMYLISYRYVGFIASLVLNYHTMYYGFIKLDLKFVHFVASF
uniref:MRH domain-containing protein n=2 Tax=Aplanochytrium stocchinoi TaxID=215587 RepID=A0A7S3PQW6_9STRA|mmetsp:Transcript_34702/g.42792  ORF Transcript_34702/g.42792 Transcript_34702/m.42792 type:complete len:282 (-) Transcript_34702:379-1224(-)